MKWPQERKDTAPLYDQNVHWPKISIVTPSYNQGQYIEETILSVLNQKYPNLEYIIIDGGSTDNTVDIIKKYEQSLTYWESKKDKGQSEAINKGFRRATGDVINWLCSDDLLEEDALYHIAKAFIEDQTIGLVHGGTILFDRSNENIGIDFGYKDLNKERYLAGIVFPQPSGFFKRALLSQSGLVDESLHFCMDYHLYARLALLAEFKRVEIIFSRYRLHPASKSVKDASKFIEEWIPVYINIVKENGFSETFDILKKTGVFDTTFFVSGMRNTTSSKSKEIDQKKLTYYFLCYVLKHYYAIGLLKEARKILHYLYTHYDHEALKKEKEIDPIKTRLSLLPDFLIFILRKIKRNGVSG